MKGLSKEVKSAIIIGVVIVILLILGIIYGQKEKTEVVDTSTLTTTAAVAETTTAAVAETTVADATTTTAAPTTSAQVTVPAGAVVTKASDGKWALVNGGTVVTSFTGVATNDLGTWYIESGYVNFGFSGKVVFNGVTYDIENGKVV